MSELLRNSLFSGILLHASYLALVILLYISMRNGFIRNNRRKEIALDHVYLGCALMLISDCAWSVVSSVCVPGNTWAYVINLAYFISSSSAAVFWLIFCIKNLDIEFRRKKTLRFCALMVYDIMFLLYVLSPWCGFIFSIRDGEYIRGSLFILDPVIKMGYICAASLLAVICGRRKGLPYLRKNDFKYAFFGLPVMVCGVLQVVVGMDFNCLGITAALVMVYANGITNPDSENADSIYSLANSFDAAYIVNMDTDSIRQLHNGYQKGKDLAEAGDTGYSVIIRKVISDRVCMEDRQATLEGFDLLNIAERFRMDSSFNIRYRAVDSSGKTVLHTATFIKAAGKTGKQEFMLGIQSISADSLFHERSENLKSEGRSLEHINNSILESVAKIVEARDTESGEHVVRVKKFTEIIARVIMENYPEYGLNEEKIRLISSASVLHDIGKIVIPDAVLLKPGRLTEDEFKVMKTHTTRGCDVLNMFPLGLDDAFLECAMSICRWHHEKYDGKGYPDGLAGSDIPIAAQIVSFADCFDALVSNRPYKKAFTPEKAFEMIANGECGAFSPKIMYAVQEQKGRLLELARLYKASSRS